MNRRERISRTLLACLASAVLAGAATAPVQAQTPVVRFVVERFEVQGNNPLSQPRTQEILAPYTGEHAGVDGLLAAADALERAIEEAGVAFQRVVLPPQSLHDGTVVLRVAVFRVARVEVRGARHHSEANVRRSVPSLREGETPDTGAIARDMAEANRLGWKTANLTFRESETDPEGLDAVLEVEDRRPWLAWSGLDNTGSADTGRFRWSLGASAGNLFDRDHSVNASYVTSPGHTDQVSQWAASYTAPVHGLGGTLSAYYVRSDVDTGRVLDLLDVSGAGEFAGLQYTRELRRRGRLSQRLSVGIEDRRFDNEVLLAGSDIAPPAVRSRPVSLGWAAEYAGDGWGLDVRMQYARSLESGSGNDDTAYDLNREGARPGWDVVRGGATLTWSLPAGWTARGLVDGQAANEPLVAGEQYGLGGAGTVRGFSEREVARDEGVRGSVELWSPAVAGAGARFLVFADAGRVSNAADGAARSGDTIASVGAGLRWSWKEHVALLVDVGVIVEGTETRESGARGHLNLLVRY